MSAWEIPTAIPSPAAAPAAVVIRAASRAASPCRPSATATRASSSSATNGAPGRAAEPASSRFRSSRSPAATSTRTGAAGSAAESCSAIARAGPDCPASSNRSTADRSPAAPAAAAGDCSSRMVISITAALTRCRSAVVSGAGRPTARNARPRPPAPTDCRLTRSAPSEKPAPTAPRWSISLSISAASARLRAGGPAGCSASTPPPGSNSTTQPASCRPSRATTRSGSGVGERGLRQGLLSGKCPGDGGVFIGGDGCGDGPADRDERCPPGHLQNWQAAARRGAQQFRRRFGVAQSDAEPETDHGSGREPLDVVLHLALVDISAGGIERQPGGEQQLTATEERRRVPQFTDVYPGGSDAPSPRPRRWSVG